MNIFTSAIYNLVTRKYYINKVPSKHKICEVVSLLAPVKSPYRMIRIGGSDDGAYLIPDDLNGIEMCFSPGVGHTNRFELELYSDYDIKCAAADASVDGLPEESDGINFIKKYIGNKDCDPSYITLSKWMSSFVDFDDGSDFLLQMDIEGGEYDVLISEDIETLSKFRIIAIEFHNLELMLDRYGIELLDSILRKITSNFHPVYIHPNNVPGFFEREGVVIPRVLEVVFLRKDRFDECIYLENLDSFSHLSVTNDQNKPEIKLSRHWFKT
tara:strand:+ start:5064 stop:5873 length:810 start_codon:yes stop_codon:yes gene_type:complete